MPAESFRFAGLSAVVGTLPAAYNVGIVREYTYRVDGEGRIFHDGSEIVDAATLRFFLLALQRTRDGRWLALCQGERNWFEPEDTPFVVQRLKLGVAGGRLRSVDLCLAGDYREPLDPATLEHDGARLFCRVRKGAFTARFGRMAMQQIAPCGRSAPCSQALRRASRALEQDRSASRTR